MLKPLRDKIVVKVKEVEEKTSEGIILASSQKEAPSEGVVIAVGTGKLKKGDRVALEVKVGDNIVFSKYSGTELKHEGADYLILREDDVLVVIE